jgi:LmbE family N-acetylglucosaminyl deacetylase
MTDGAELRSDHLLVQRPHFQLRGDSLFRVGSKQPQRRLSEAEAAFWNLIYRRVSVSEVRETYGELADALIREFLSSEFCELAEPTFPTGRRRVLVIEPHADDAVLSIGGTLWLRRLECQFVIATMASRSNHTRYADLDCDFFDIKEITEIRRRESELFARMIGGDYLSVGMTDAALRYHDGNWNSDFYLRHRMSVRVATSRIADDRERERWTEAVRRLLTEHPSAEVWFPLGGPHTDHMLTADACVAAFLSHPSLVAGRVLRVYQESPYTARYPRHMNGALDALRKSGAVLEQELSPMTEACERKRRLATIYDSQDIEEMRPDTDASELILGPALGRSELLWTLKTLPNRIDPGGIVSSAITRHERDGEIAAWVSHNRDTERLRVLLPMPTGRWAGDLELLSAAFPRATFEVYVAPSAEAEVSEALSKRVEIRRVGSGTKAWILLALRLSMQMKALPTLFHSGQRRLRQARLLAKSWLRSDTLIVASMDPLVSVLRNHAGE